MEGAATVARRDDSTAALNKDDSTSRMFLRLLANPPENRRRDWDFRATPNRLRRTGRKNKAPLSIEQPVCSTTAPERNATAAFRRLKTHERRPDQVRHHETLVLLGGNAGCTRAGNIEPVSPRVRFGSHAWR